ncbi:MAG: extracellular solute-binding protein [Deltaproteobacteria bacterium]|nr:extracellular solute-binding protein [Deltaproteobacteria bacterium]
MRLLLPIIFSFAFLLCSRGKDIPKTTDNIEVSSEAKENTEILLWHSYRGQEQKALEKCARLFSEKNPHIKLKTLQIPYDAFIDKISVAVPRGHGPDPLIMAHNMIGEWTDEEKILQNITDMIERESLDEFMLESVRALVYKQALYGLPLAYKNLALFYNKEMVKKPPATVDEMIKIASENTSEKDGRFGLAYEAGLLFFHAPWFFGFGGEVFSKDGGVAVNSPAAKESLDFARNLVNKHGIVPRGMTSYIVTSMFNSGKAAMVINGQWFLSEIEGNVNFGVVPLPAISPEKKPKPFLTIEAVFMARNCKNKDAAIEAMKFLVSDESARIRALEGRQTVANKETYDIPEIKDDPIFEAFRRQAEDSIIIPSSPEMQVVWSTMDMAINGAVFGDKEIAESLSKAEEKIRKDIEMRTSK